VFAAANERFTRKKGDSGFPHAALDEALRYGGIGLDDVDRVVMANRTHFVYRLMKWRFEDYQHDFFNLKQKVYLKYHDLMCAASPVAPGVGALNRLVLTAQERVGFELCDHHEAHACGAIATSGFDECLAVTVDNLGDGYAAKVHSYRGGELEFLWGSRASDSPGQFYGEISQVLGFNPLRHAGKVTGLAAHGDPERAYALMAQLFGLTGDGRGFWMMPSWQRWKRRGPCWRLGLFSAEDVAAAAQKRLEDVVTAYVQRAVTDTGHTRLVLAGGVFSNVKLNLEVKRLRGVEAVHVHPAMSDEGLAYGAAASYMLRRGELPTRALPHAYLGPEIPDEAVDAAVHDSSLAFSEEPAMARTVAGLLDRGHVIARFDGRLEYGPRALGHRSILYRPDDPTVNEWLNHKLHRTEFMPFAPITRWEDADECYEEVEGAADTARFMTICFPCKPTMRDRCGGVVHVDGTARPQLVCREHSPFLHELLTEYREISGLPALINTSFNMHEEPIVGSPQDAVTAHRAAGLDFLAIGRYLAHDPARPDLEESLRDVRTRDQ